MQNPDVQYHPPPPLPLLYPFLLFLWKVFDISQNYVHLMKGTGPRTEYCTASLSCPIVIDEDIYE